VSHNTSYSNEGHGLFISDDGDLPIAIDHNIAFQNGGYGRYGAFSADASCNDWFGNVLGVAYPMGPTDLQVDPMFCDVAHDSVTLSAQSPLVDPVGCGLIGALGVGCGVVGLESEPRSVALAVRWAGASGRAAVTLPNGTPATLEVIDVQGRKISGVRLSGLGAGPHEVELGRGLRSGVYFARLSQGHDVAVAKGVVLR
jgi:hypothetical protein